MKNNNLTTAIFYTCGTCNLNCKYCGIDKSPILKDIDNALGKSFADENYYFKFTLEDYIKTRKKYAKFCSV